MVDEDICLIVALVLTAHGLQASPETANMVQEAKALVEGLAEHNDSETLWTLVTPPSEN